jgi:Putative redox-active protein (C_GCAxxG_C_C)
MTKDQLVAAIRDKARLLYEGKQVAHRSCGMAIAETFGRDPRPYQALRRGGITGVGQCGAVVAGGLVLGELFGYPDATAPVSITLREAMTRYHALVARRLPRGSQGTIVCNDLTAPFPEFQSEERMLFCTVIAATVAEIVAEIVIELGGTLDVTPIRDA